MDTMQKAFLIGHTLIALGIIALVLLQRGKGADAGAAFGAGASGTVFGARGSSSFFSRMTAIFATAFFASSLALAYMSSQRGEAPTSLLEGVPQEESSVDALPVDDELLPTSELPSVDDVSDLLPSVDEELPEVAEDEQESD